MRDHITKSLLSCTLPHATSIDAPSASVPALNSSMSMISRARRFLQAAKRRTCFLDLPAELRNEVYSLLLSPERDKARLYVTLPSKRSFWALRPTPRRLALLFANRQVSEEAACMFYSEHDFELPTISDAAEFLSRLRPVVLRSLRRLHVIDTEIRRGIGHRECRMLYWLDDVRFQINVQFPNRVRQAMRPEALSIEHWCLHSAEGLRYKRVGHAVSDLKAFHVIQEHGAWKIEMDPELRGILLERQQRDGPDEYLCARRRNGKWEVKSLHVREAEQEGADIITRRFAGLRMSRSGVENSLRAIL